MLKALLKKQFIELFKSYFVNRKTGKARSQGGVIGYFILFAVLLGVLAVTFFGMATTIASPFCSMGLDWLYFALLGLMATLLGTFGSVFNTYAGIYHSKDNEMLLSMPIKPSQILFARMAGVYLLGLLYESIVFAPAIVCYWLYSPVTVTKIVFPIILLFVLGFFITALTCLLGWIVALISGKLKNKSAITIILSLIFFALYYFVCFRFSNILASIVQNAQAISVKIKTIVFPAYTFGMGCIGKPIYFIAFIVFSAVCMLLTCIIMSKSFIKITTMNKGNKKSVYKEKAVTQQSLDKALFRKELKRFVSSPTYFMNCGFGLFIMPVIGIVALIKAEAVLGYVNTIEFDITNMIPVAIACIVGMMCSVNNISAPSISLEGKSLWILQSLPVEPYNILRAKVNVHAYLNSAASILGAVLIATGFKCEIQNIVLISAFLYIYNRFTGSIGIMLNLKMPNLTWTNEMVPIKQGMPIMIGIFGGWIVSFAVGAIYFSLMDNIAPSNYLAAIVVIFALITVFCEKWLKNKGTKIFISL